VIHVALSIVDHSLDHFASHTERTRQRVLMESFVDPLRSSVLRLERRQIDFRIARAAQRYRLGANLRHRLFQAGSGSIGGNVNLLGAAKLRWQNYYHRNSVASGMHCDLLSLHDRNVTRLGPDNSIPP